MKKYLLDLRLRRITSPAPGYALLQLTDPVRPLPPMAPGQFVQVRVDGAPATFLRRPISIHFVDRETNELWLLVRAIGDGTRRIAALVEGATLNVLLPLGRGFTVERQTPSPSLRGVEGSPTLDVAASQKAFSLCEDTPQNILLSPSEEGRGGSHEGPGGHESLGLLLVGGGVGVAPLLFLGSELVRFGHRPIFLLGGRTAADLVQLDHFRRLGEVCLTTEDGSAGERGFVTQHSLWQRVLPLAASPASACPSGEASPSPSFGSVSGGFPAGFSCSRIYTCGPKPMMQAVARLARERGIPCEVSLENQMACGLGACLCCVEDTTSGHRCVCTDGPVFDVDELKW